MKKIYTLPIIIAAVSFPSAAFAQDSEVEITAGPTVGFWTGDGFSGFVGGGFVAADFDISENITAGGEVSANLGIGDVSADYAVTGRIGYRFDNDAKVYGRLSYQTIELDFETEFGDFSVSDSEFILGVGVDYPVGDFTVRGTADFDSADAVRIMGGVAFKI